jgi:hypothetical protein
MLPVTHYQRDSSLINQVQNVTGDLDKSQIKIKRLLNELSYCLSKRCVNLRDNNGHLELYSLDGSFRRLTFRERLGYRLLNIVPQM